MNEGVGDIYESIVSTVTEYIDNEKKNLVLTVKSKSVGKSMTVMKYTGYATVLLFGWRMLVNLLELRYIYVSIASYICILDLSWPPMDYEYRGCSYVGTLSKSSICTNFGLFSLSAGNLLATAQRVREPYSYILHSSAA